MDDKTFGTYRELAVWKKSVQFARLVYAQTEKFPDSERHVLVDQLRRAAISIPSNIAEGNGRATNRDYAYFLSVARGSLYEVMNQLDLAEVLGYINHSDEIESLAIELRKMIFSMIKRFSNSAVQPSTFNLQSETP